jgi:hypothetical protein
MAAQRMVVLGHGQQRLNLGPQGVGDAPMVFGLEQSHADGLANRYNAAPVVGLSV